MQINKRFRYTVAILKDGYILYLVSRKLSAEAKNQIFSNTPVPTTDPTFRQLPDSFDTVRLAVGGINSESVRSRRRVTWRSANRLRTE